MRKRSGQFSAGAGQSPQTKKRFNVDEKCFKCGLSQTSVLVELFSTVFVDKRGNQFIKKDDGFLYNVDDLDHDDLALERMCYFP